MSSQLGLAVEHTSSHPSVYDGSTNCQGPKFFNITFTLNYHLRIILSCLSRLTKKYNRRKLPRRGVLSIQKISVVYQNILVTNFFEHLCTMIIFELLQCNPKSGHIRQLLKKNGCVVVNIHKKQKIAVKLYFLISQILQKMSS